MRIRNKRGSSKIGPVRINRSGLAVTSVTVSVLWKTIVLWERKGK